MAGRVTLLPMSLNIAPGGTPGILIPAASVGYDTGSPGGTFTPWGSINGVQFVNNGQMILAFINGASSCLVSILIGQKAGGVVPLFSTLQSTIPASAPPGWLPPLSPQAFNQTDATVHSGAPAGVIGAAGQGMTCIDFATTTTLGVRLYQLTPITP